MNEVVAALKQYHKTISTMESCTGGALVNAITNVDGASEILKYSAITYSNEYKIKMGVNKKIIEKYTAYSFETVKEMSKVISDYTLSDYSIGISGKLNRIDANNLFGNDNEVFYSIYDRSKNRYFTNKIIAKDKDRLANKSLLIDIISKDLLKIIKMI